MRDSVRFLFLRDARRLSPLLANEFMGYVNMIYLATLTDRVPIIPPFAPDHHICMLPFLACRILITLLTHLLSFLRGRNSFW